MDAHALLRGELQDFAQQWYALSGKVAVKPCTCVEHLQLRDRHVLGKSVPVGRAVHGHVMKHDDLAVPAHDDIDLEGRATEFHGAAERGHGVFGPVDGMAAVGAHVHPAS